jgi:hypothetical protein
LQLLSEPKIRPSLAALPVLVDDLEELRTADGADHDHRSIEPIGDLG